MTHEMKNLMDADLSEGEAMLCDVYRQLARAVEMHGDELPPFAGRNARKAMAALWQVMSGLDMDPGQLYHVGV
jgi:hypothetical protein